MRSIVLGSLLRRLRDRRRDLTRSHARWLAASSPRLVGGRGEGGRHRARVATSRTADRSRCVRAGPRTPPVRAPRRGEDRPRVALSVPRRRRPGPAASSSRCAAVGPSAPTPSMSVGPDGAEARLLHGTTPPRRDARPARHRHRRGPRSCARRAAGARSPAHSPPRGRRGRPRGAARRDRAARRPEGAAGQPSVRHPAIGRPPRRRATSGPRRCGQRRALSARGPAPPTMTPGGHVGSSTHKSMRSRSGPETRRSYRCTPRGSGQRPIRRPGVTARARVHRREQLEPRREPRRAPGAGDRDPPLLERLAERLEHVAVELRELVEEQHPVVGERHLARRQARSATDHRGVRDRVVRRAERWPADERP